MLSVLIVDDEVITRKGLKAHIDWEKLNIDRIYDSGNAQEALKMVQNYQPDIILSDVNMPGMNGIEMCQVIREARLECQIVFLSGYSDKEYLKGAISLEAVDYVEKPIDIEEVEDALTRAAEKQLQNKRKNEKIHRLVTENLSLVTKNLVEQMISTDISPDAYAADFEKLHLDWSAMSEFAVIFFQLYPQEVQSRRALLGTLRQAFRPTSFVYTMKEKHRLIFVCAGKEGSILTLQQQLCELVKKQSRKVAYCAVGKNVSDIASIYQSYQTAAAAMQRMRFWNQQQFCIAGDVQEKTLQFEEEIFKNFTDGLKQYQKEKAVRAMQDLDTFMKQQRGVPVRSVKGIYFRFIEALFQKAEFSKDQSMISDGEIVSMIWEKLHSIHTLTGCHRYLTEETEEYFRNVSELAENNQTMILVISYIRAHYSEVDLGLESIADNVYLSQNYLSTLFKKKMGKSISQYIVDVRIAHAKELLCDRSLKLYDVAVGSGYKDANYFTKVFKKAVGVTPSKYRESHHS